MQAKSQSALGSTYFSSQSQHLIVKWQAAAVASSAEEGSRLLIFYIQPRLSLICSLSIDIDREGNGLALAIVSRLGEL